MSSLTADSPETWPIAVLKMRLLMHWVFHWFLISCVWYRPGFHFPMFPMYFQLYLWLSQKALWSKVRVDWTSFSCQPQGSMDKLPDREFPVRNFFLWLWFIFLARWMWLVITLNIFPSKGTLSDWTYGTLLCCFNFIYSAQFPVDWVASGDLMPQLEVWPMESS